MERAACVSSVALSLHSRRSPAVNERKDIPPNEAIGALITYSETEATMHDVFYPRVPGLLSRARRYSVTLALQL